MLTTEEKQFILQLFAQTKVSVNDPNAVEICNFVRSITLKFKEEEQ